MTTISKNLWPTLMIVASLWGFLGYIQPQFEEIRLLQEEKKEYEQAISNANEVRILRGNLIREYDSIPSDQWARLTRLLPNTVDGVKLVFDVSGVAAVHGLRLDSFSITENSQSDSSARGSLLADPGYAPNAAAIATAPTSGRGGSAQLNTGSGAAASTGTGSKIFNTDVEFTFLAAYPNFTAFLRDLEKSLQMFDVVSVSLDVDKPGVSATSNTGSASKPVTDDRYSLSVKLRTYSLR